MAEPTHNEIITEIRAVKTILDIQAKYDEERRVGTDNKLDKIVGTQSEHGTRLRKLEDVATLGRGAYWAALKIGGFLAVVAGAAAFIWEKIAHIAR